jgi:hypothetical protein
MLVMQTVSMIFKPNLVHNSHFSHACQTSCPCQLPRCHIPVIRDEYKYEVLHCMVFSKLLSIPPSYAQIFSSEPPSSGHVKNKLSYTYTPPIPSRCRLYLFPTLSSETEQTLLTFNLLKPTGYVMHHQFHIQQLYILPTLYLCVLYLSQQTATSAPYNMQ